MTKAVLVAALATLIFEHHLRADDFTVITTKNMHDDLALTHDIYTTAQSEGVWDPQCEWLRNPAVGVQFNVAHVEEPAFYSAETYNPMLVLKARTYADINVGLIYSRSMVQREFGTLFGTFHQDIDTDSFGAYVAKQCDCGFNAGLAYTYSSTKSFDGSAAIGSVGFARGFGEKKAGHNIFVDTSANFLYGAEGDIWDFVWLGKVGTAFCERFAAYGIFNLYHALNAGQVGAFGYASRDDTLGEAGAGIQAQLGKGFSITFEGTTPVLNWDGQNTFALRTDVTWRF